MSRSRIAELEAVIRRLRNEVEYLRANPMMARGLRGETLIAELIAATRARKGAPHDIELRFGQVRFEIKYSSLLQAAARGRPVRRWVWTKLFGELGQKRYHRLLLCGAADPRYTDSYIDPSAPYVIFDLPYPAAVRLVGSVKNGRAGRLELTTNPKTVSSARALELYQRFQISREELARRYRNLRPTPDSVPNSLRYSAFDQSGQ